MDDDFVMEPQAIMDKDPMYLIRLELTGVVYDMDGNAYTLREPKREVVAAFLSESAAREVFDSLAITFKDGAALFGADLETDTTK